MNKILFVFSSAVDDFRRNKMRTFLTSLGILIGISVVVLLLAFGLGLKKYIKQQLESLGTNLIMIMPGQTFSGGAMSMASSMGSIKFDEKDVVNLKKIKNTTYVVPFYIKFSKIQGPLKTEIAEIAGSDSNVLSALNLGIEYGVSFKKSDVERGSKKIILGPSIAKKLFGSAEKALNGNVKIEDQHYKVIGIPKSKGGGGFGGSSIDDHVFVPYKSIASYNVDKNFLAIYVKANDSKNLNQIKADIKKRLLKRYKEDDFSIGEQTDILNTVNSVFGVINFVLVGIGAISLLVGGIGIMNIMYVSVTERIKEIGIRRAFGATTRDILFHFLAEAVLLSLIGAILALVFCYTVVFFIHNYFPAYIDLGTVALALIVSSAIGIFFGVSPAKRAADLQPVEAIRYE